MNTNRTRNTETGNAVIINANPAKFRNGTHNRAERLVEALRPITNVWYREFKEAAGQGTTALLEAFRDYHKVYIATPDHMEDEIFRYAALAIILQSVKTDIYFEGKAQSNDLILMLIQLILNDVRHMAEYWFPKTRFADENEVFALASGIDALAEEYRVEK